MHDGIDDSSEVNSRLYSMRLVSDMITYSIFNFMYSLYKIILFRT